MVTLLQKFAGKPFKILAYPCNDFADQEPHANNVIEQFALSKGFNGTLFSKTNVPHLLSDGSCDAKDGCTSNSTDCCPANSALWQWITTQKTVEKNGVIPWNFEKYLCNKQGVPVSRTGASTNPTDSIADIEKLLAEL
eukprot:m.112010 g.112010  ORF g.112010 m.112010 type:complete len:138 (-) comp17022_c0_seq2:452-865(-)